MIIDDPCLVEEKGSVNLFTPGIAIDNLKELLHKLTGDFGFPDYTY